MSETIYTIPISEAFEQDAICPLCALKHRFATELADQLCGSAVMEPDVRIETNRLGLCQVHFAALLSRQKRLSLALIQETHLMAIAEVLAGEGKRSRKSDPVAERLCEIAQSCYICERLDKQETQAISNTVHRFKRDADFRDLFSKREDFCLPHVAAMLSTAKRELGSKYDEFAAVLLAGFSAQLSNLLTDVRGFVASFDYRNAGKPLTEGERLAVEAVIPFLTGYDCTQL